LPDFAPLDGTNLAHGHMKATSEYGVAFLFEPLICKQMIEWTVTQFAMHGGFCNHYMRAA